MDCLLLDGNIVCRFQMFFDRKIKCCWKMHTHILFSTPVMVVLVVSRATAKNQVFVSSENSFILFHTVLSIFFSLQRSFSSRTDSYNELMSANFYCIQSTTMQILKYQTCECFTTLPVNISS